MKPPSPTQHGAAPQPPRGFTPPSITAGTGQLTTGTGASKTTTAVTTPISLGSTDSHLVDNETGAVITGGDARFDILEQGTGATITLGNGNDHVTVTGSGATITLGNGNDVIEIGTGHGGPGHGGPGGGHGFGPPPPSSSSSSTAVPVTSDTITLGSGTNMIFLGGSGNTVNLGTGSTTVEATGALNNHFVLASAGGNLTLNGFSTTNGDTLDLTQLLSGVSLASDLSNLGSFIGVATQADAKHAGWTDTVLTITGTAGTGTVTLVNTGSSLTLASLETSSLILPTH